MHSLLVKIVSLASLFFVTFFAGIIPLKLRRTRTESANHQLQNIPDAKDLRRRQIISLSTCFAGGAFFASSMLELFPMVRREFKTVLETANIKTDFPISEFSISIGFFLILTVEQIIHVMKEKRNATLMANSEPTTPTLLMNGDSKPHYGATILHGEDNSATTLSDNESHDGSDNEPPIDLSESHDHHHDHASHHTYQLASNKQHHHNSQLTDSLDDHDHHSHNMFFNNSHKHQNKRHYLRSYLLLIALSIHALFEGLAVGLFQSVDSMVELLGALIIHKCILAFSIAINLVQHSFPSSTIVKSSLLFSATSPIGLGIGILMLNYTSTNLGHILSSIFQAIATGTFLYVTFFEIFFHELNSRECNKLLKVLMMIIGFAILAVVQFFDTKINK